MSINTQNVIKIPPDSHDPYSGLFIVVDGIIFIHNLGDVSVSLHMDLYKMMLLKFPELMKYHLYPYYYFPRGAVISNNKTNWVLLNAPVEFSEHQVTKLLNAFGQDNKQIEVIDGEHYSLHFVESQIRSNHWDPEIETEEIRFATEFYMGQISRY
jgi:hypothetical protein